MQAVRRLRLASALLVAVPLSCAPAGDHAGSPAGAQVAATVPDRAAGAAGVALAAPTPSTSSTSPSPARASTAVSARRAAVPVAVRIPQIGVASPLVRLGLKDGRLEVPQDYDRAGWYERGPRPGEPGPAVIVGHVDSTTGPAVFYRLGRLGPGSRVEVQRADGSQVHFVIDRVETFGKDEFPTELVYGRQREPELRLITCGGDFDSSSGHYEDNVVAFGRQA